jgi:hypothetical protein
MVSQNVTHINALRQVSCPERLPCGVSDVSGGKVGAIDPYPCGLTAPSMSIRQRLKTMPA